MTEGKEDRMKKFGDGRDWFFQKRFGFLSIGESIPSGRSMNRNFSVIGRRGVFTGLIRNVSIR